MIQEGSFMSKSSSPIFYNELERSLQSCNSSPPIEEFSKEHSEKLMNLIHENMKEFDHGEKTLSTTYRRIKNLETQYSKKGHILFFIRETLSGEPIACAGVGSFQNLPITEKIGEIRDLVVVERYRNQGLGRKLLYSCLREAQKLGYKRLYIETSRQMTVARTLFTQAGFEAVEELPKKNELSENMPYYYLFQDLQLKKFSLEKKC